MLFRLGLSGRKDRDEVYEQAPLQTEKREGGTPWRDAMKMV